MGVSRLSVVVAAIVGWYAVSIAGVHVRRTKAVEEVAVASLEKSDVVVFTVSTGAYDPPFEVKTKEPGVDYILFTDKPDLRSETWEVVHLATDEPLWISRKIKASPDNFFPRPYKKSVYIDGNVEVTGPVSELFDQVGDAAGTDVAIFNLGGWAKAPLASLGPWTMKFEVEEAKRYVERKGNGRWEPSAVDAQVNRFRAEYPDIDEMTAYYGKIIVREHNARTQAFGDIWYEEFLRGVPRDQISLPYALRKAGAQVKPLNHWFTHFLGPTSACHGCLGDNQNFKRYFTWHCTKGNSC